MNTLMEASYEFMSRPDDERFINLHTLDNFCQMQKENSKEAIIASRKLEFAPTRDNKGIVLAGRNNEANPTHWSFNQLATLSGVPSALLRKQCENSLAPLAADNLNAGMQVIRDVEDVGLLVREDTIYHDVDYNSLSDLNNPVPYSSKEITLAAATGPRYGRIWNADVTKELVKRFGNGVGDSSWRVPGMFGKQLDEVTKQNTTLYASDRDMFVFLADEENRIELPNRRNGEKGSLAKGFFVYNSEVGSKTLGLAFFLFDYVCCNRIVWGVEEFQKIAIRHTSCAPDRWMEEILPTIQSYSQISSKPMEARLIAAQQQKLDNAEAFLLKRFSNSQTANILATHMAEENRPIETLWDATTAITAYAKTINHTDTRVEMEKEGGKLLDLAKVELDAIF